MASIWNSINDKYNYLLYDLSSPVTRDWFLMSSPLQLIAILIIYNVFCTKIGPLLMRNRAPYKLETPIKLYNLFQVIISLYITYEGCSYLFSGDFNWQCQGIDEKTTRVAQGIQVYLITKLIELLDTVFFVFRKSYRQITFLHLYHHTLMPVVSWIGLKYFPGGQGVIPGTVNSFVHVFMYSYYLLSGLGPQYQKYLWWKKYLTVMQIVQFIFVFLQNFNSLFYPCSYPMVVKILLMTFSLVFVYMFSTFYYVTYIMQRPKGHQHSINNESSKVHNGYDHLVSNGKMDNNEENFANGDVKTKSNRMEFENRKNINGTNGDLNGKHLSGKRKSKNV